MNTLAARFYSDTHYPIPHADFLRLQHAHSVGVLFLDMLDQMNCCGQRPDSFQQNALASVVAVLTDQLGQVVTTCESHINHNLEATAA
ncbi:MAG: hypothetical protein ACQER3_02800 [Pseudomonadota bacterium]|jgi:hypothetical protein|uniref:Uncharacterized protein n=1 Tax=Serratia fonticola TaxID=47917 RepID=A0ABY9PJW3_SERFO|nr:hypothetical protein [Serratia fonticola]NXZ89516.1 hypothetical protein [Serratia fonticola]QIP90669.1 hypothetical protein HAP32_01187 [Serratia fonticola]WMT13687.1 hypothetical protein RFB13_21080 [Serratia fonticola]